jgi:hypothetical protein
MLAAMFYHPAAPQLVQHLDHLVGTLAAGSEIHPVDVELLLHPADTGAEDKTVITEDRQCGAGPGHLVRIAQGQHVDAAGEMQCCGDRRHGGEDGGLVRVLIVRLHRRHAAV